MKVAIVTEALWKMAGGARVVSAFASMYKDADIYCLFGHSKQEDREKYLDSELASHNFFFSSLNKYPFIKKLYRYTFPLWKNAIENFDFSSYDLVISCSSSVAHGVIVPVNCKHISYIHTPVRYAWDMYNDYFTMRNFPLASLVSKKTMHDMRIWDVCAADRADLLLCNSHFIQARIHKYWRKDAHVIYPPVNTSKFFTEKRENYFVVGAPFDHNKAGDFVLECAKELGFKLKVIGEGNLYKKLKNKYKNSKNIEFLGWVEEEEKFRVISKASGFIVGGTEDYSIFCAEAICCGAPVIAYKDGGSVEIIKEDTSGLFFTEHNLDNFKQIYGKFIEKRWNYREVKDSIENYNTKDSFKNKIVKLLKENGI